VSGAAASSGPPAPEAPIPWLGLTAVLLGTFISTLTTRLSTFGLADVEGGVHAGFDEGAWITTAFTVCQMLVTPIALWVGGVFGPRRPLMWAALAFASVSLVEPLSPNLPTLLVMQGLGGLSTGWFIPLTLGFILRNTAPRIWAFGIALYALNLELSINISASLEGFYVDYLTWRWIFWQNVPLALGMALCLYYARKDPPVSVRPRVDGFGLAATGLGLAAIYAALDQGNRVDWLNSGLIWGLFLSGVVLVAGFLIHERRAAEPFVNLRVVFADPLPRLLLLIAFVRLTVLSTAFLIPQYLGAVRGFRALEVGQSLFWVAAPQLAVCALAAILLRRVDPRIVACIGFVLIAIACLLVAHGLTPLWGSDQFLPSALIQALGQSLALSGIVFFAVLHLRPADALSFGAAFQTARLLGGELGTAFVATLTRVRGQIASNLIGLHVQVGDLAVTQRLQTYALATARGNPDPVAGSARGVGVLAAAVRQAAVTQGVIDAFVAIAGLTALALLLVVSTSAAPLGPASHTPLFARRSPAS
jgi:DHA2 family multidrug resistance protein